MLDAGCRTAEWQGPQLAAAAAAQQQAQRQPAPEPSMGGALSFTHTSPCFSAHWKAVAQARGAEGSPPWGITVQVPHPLNCQPAGRDVGRAGRRRGRLESRWGPPWCLLNLQHEHPAISQGTHPPTHRGRHTEARRWGPPGRRRGARGGGGRHPGGSGRRPSRPARSHCRHHGDRRANALGEQPLCCGVVCRPSCQPHHLQQQVQ